jgi:hypothetical protein
LNKQEEEGERVMAAFAACMEGAYTEADLKDHLVNEEYDFMQNKGVGCVQEGFSWDG